MLSYCFNPVDDGLLELVSPLAWISSNLFGYSFEDSFAGSSPVLQH